MEEEIEEIDLDVIVTYELEGRRVKKTKAPVINFLPEEEAIIVVDISVDEFGNVVETDWNPKKTKGAWISILRQTIDAIKETKFNRLPYDTDYDVNHYTSDDYLSNLESECQKGEVTVKFFVDE